MDENGKPTQLNKDYSNKDKKVGYKELSPDYSDQEEKVGYGERYERKHVDSEEEIDHSRREFLGAAATVGASLAVGGAGVFARSQWPDQKYSFNSPESLEKEPLTYDNVHEEEMARQRVELNIEEIEGTKTPLDKFFEYESPSIHKIDNAEIETATRWYEEQHTKEGGPLQISLKEGMERMEQDYERLVQICERHKVKPNFIYIALPESYYQVNQRGRKKGFFGAVGCYQIIKSTGRLLGMQINRKVDERFDKFKSADAAMRLLKDNYKKLGNSTEFAVLAYNKHYVWKYMSDCKKYDIIPSVPGFMDDMRRRVDDIRRNIQGGFPLKITVGGTETLESLSKHYLVSVSEIIKENNLTDETITKGQSLKIPTPKNEADRKRVFEREVYPIKENLNYLSKFRGILRAIKVF